MLKGIFSGLGSLTIGFLIGQSLPEVKYSFLALALGFVAYGLSIFFYIKAQKQIGATKTSAYYSFAPFIGTFLSFFILKEEFSLQFLIALFLMTAGSILVTIDILSFRHHHVHTHVIRHTHDGSTHTHTITHDHEHFHLANGNHHHHFHRLPKNI